MTKEQFLVTRPALAARLMEAGADAQISKNPFSPGRTAWLFRLEPMAAEVARSFYAEIGKPLPQRLAAYLAQLEREEVAG